MNNRKKPLHLGHGLNLKPRFMLPLAQALDRRPHLHQLNDHLDSKQLHLPHGHWQRWNQQADEWIKGMDEQSDVVAYSLSAPLIINALERAHKKVARLLLLSPAFIFRSQKIMQSLSQHLPDHFPIPSFNSPQKNCSSWLPLGLYRELWQNASLPHHLPAQQVQLYIHRHDELLDSKAIIVWGELLNIVTKELHHPKLPLFHATYQSARLPLADTANFLNSKT